MEKPWVAHYQHPVAWDQKFPPLSLVEMVVATAQAKPDAVMVDFMGRKTSYGEMLQGIRRVARGLQALGIGKGDRVGLYLPNVPHYVTAYYGAMMAGATVVNFSPLYTAAELEHQVGDSGTKILFTLSAKTLLPTAQEVLDNSSLERLVVGTICEALPPAKSLLYRLFKRAETAPVPHDPRITSFAQLLHHGDDPAPVAIDAQDIALLQYTGGTTGTPKGAMLSHQNLTANARQIVMMDPHRDMDDRIIAVLPFFHVFANTCILNRTVLNGGEIVMLPRFEAVQVLAAIQRTKATSLPGVPTMYQALLDHPATPNIDFSSLRVCISGGAPLPLEVKQRFEEVTGAKLVEGYGLTESSPVVCSNPYEGVNKTGTVGQPVPGTMVRLVDREDPSRPPPAGEPGELVFAGPQIMKGYWQRPDADKDVFIDGGWLRTGDVGLIDADGYVKIVDRLKDMIAVGGFKVFPSQIEATLYHHPAVKEALVIGIADHYRGECPKAFVTLQDGTTTDGETLRAWLNPQLGKHEKVCEVEVRLNLPKTLVGKLSRKELVAEERAKAQGQAVPQEAGTGA